MLVFFLPFTPSPQNMPNPKITIELSKADKLIEIISWITLIFVWVTIVMNYSALPDTIPVHFGASGEPYSYGNKATIIILGFVMTFVFGMMSLLNRVPHIFNYPVKITPENARYQYTLATKLIRYINLSVVFLITFIIIMTMKIAHGEADGLGVWSLVTFMLIVFGPIANYFYKSFRASKTAPK
ncbi:MAG TPA: hypothetical protein DCE78_09635 [Bacteroidetes bacterium]|nr:hypothetical protein [Bacteroidota bacterium]